MWIRFLCMNCYLICLFKLLFAEDYINLGYTAIWSHAHFSSNLFALFQHAEYFKSDIVTFLNPYYSPERKYWWKIKGTEEKTKGIPSPLWNPCCFHCWERRTQKISVWVTFMLGERSLQLTKPVDHNNGKNYMTQHPSNCAFYCYHKKKMQYMIYFVCTHNKSLLNIKISDSCLTQKWTLHEWQVMKNCHLVGKIVACFFVCFFLSFSC